ncbi:MAG: CHAT domain-containing protein [Rhizonema sp. PD37]|nr:CHAT domain-containing protein [Rhizonema sp. PD37]
MQKLQMIKLVARFSLRNVILFTLASLLTIIPSTFAKQLEHLPSKTSAQTIQSPATTPQQLLEQGEALYQAGRFSEAATILQLAVRTYQRESNNLAQAAALTNLSLVYQQLDLWKEADAAINSSLKLLGWDEKNQKLNVNHPKSELLSILAQTLNIQGGLQLAQGQADVSLKTSQMAEQIWRKLGDHAGVMRSQINSAQALRVSGFDRRSFDILNEVSQQLLSSPDSLVKVTALRALGNTQQQFGYLEHSRKNLTLSLQIAQRLQMAQETSLTELSLGNTARALGNIEDAIINYENAATGSNPLTKVQAQINQLSLLTLKEHLAEAKALIPTIQAELANLPTNQAGIYARISFARTLTKIGNKKDIAEILATSVQQAKTIGDQRAESYALGSLGEVYEHNNQWLEAQDLTQQALFLAQKIDASDIAYLWEWQLGRLLRARGDIQSAISAYDAAVTRLQSLRRDLVAVNREVQFNFRDRVEPIYRESVELLLQQKGQGKPDLDKVRQRIEALQIAELDNFFREACLSNQFVVLDKVVDSDNPSTAVFYPIILDNHLEVILKLPHQQLMHTTYTVKRQEVEQVITKMQQMIVEPDANQKFKVVSQQLYNWLIKPVEGDLKKSKVNTLVFIPDGLLKNIPMSALYDGKEYLVQNYAVAVSPGLQLFTPKPLAQKKLSVLAGGLSLPPRNEMFAPLPNVKVELESIQQSGISTTTLLNEKFRSTTLEKAINAQPFKVVHLATHGQFSSKAKDTFILAADGRINVREFDSLLKSREQKRTEPIELLVLSACQTAAGDNRAALGLAGVALRAGARSTLASLWQIGDNSTAKFVEEFYHQLTAGKSTAEALREAQLKLLKMNEYNRPLYWAPYVLVGNWL